MAGRGRLVALVALSIAVTTAAASAQTRPVVQVLKLAPLTVRGTGFQAAERVRVTLVRGGRTQGTRLVRAGANGVFSVRFGLLVAAEPCHSLSLRAVGSNGSRAQYTHRCRPPDPALP